ncbi:MAG: glycine cleavage system protein GcvH [Coprothermobacterota bacterium]|jgi:glycine cleavage system H protein|nr:glycine cleavage system protein GcvH [Caldisericota bacterium]MDI6869424.1 glycine cleavage system protein GcvH [Coprothermobacterota bacterium]
MEVGGYLLPDDLWYHKEHFWVRMEGDVATVGVTDFFQKLAGEISYLELPSEGDEYSQDDVVGTVETGKWVGKIYSPLSGTITEVNSEVVDEPALANRDPYGSGWLFKLKASDLSELENLFKGEAALKWMEEEIRKKAK